MSNDKRDLYNSDDIAEEENILDSAFNEVLIFDTRFEVGEFLKSLKLLVNIDFWKVESSGREFKFDSQWFSVGLKVSVGAHLMSPEMFTIR